MIVTRAEQDPEALTLTVTAELAVPVERAWQLWADPRQLERWWGPPGYPATFEDHDLTPGARTNYFMTTPEGDTPRGYWDIVAVDAPHRLEVADGFAAADGSPDPVGMPDPGVMVVTLTATADGAGTVMAIESRFPSAEAMEQTLAMGQEEGMRAALTQVEEILAEVA